MQTNLFQLDHKSYIDVVKERMSLYGKDQSSIQDLLAIVIGRSADVNVCGQLSLLSVRDLLAMTAKDFSSLEGISKAMGERLEATIALSKKIGEMDLPETSTIRSPEDAYHYFRHLRHEEQEQFVVICLNVKNEVTGRKVIFKGSLNSTIVHPREVFKFALEKTAASIIVAHQHPSGNSSPSAEDIEVTKRLVDCGLTLGIECLDHIIVANDSYISLKDKGYM
ncbi:MULTISPECIES: DNA repair protein RadC [unclassified Sporosarcina]|uniref:RadC family protein n=1 Tax=unclassified Sporosarcina TaxID=2647733 RepID=UPI001A91CCF0|nr:MULTISPECIES: DNA repair protein RadC [unclassified Sporosarcina]MBO0588184.1 DNA repair protein RadC [Sporosarcina sp. E16_8]MBO0601938.1 DNA repair protein RadC [Sporosarcina sp. E16_3]